MLSRQNGTGVEASVPFFFMITLLAESKTMASSQSEVSPALYAANTPVFEEVADSLMARLASLSPLEISEILGVSNSLAVKARNLAFDFPHKLTGKRAIDAFTGEAYRGLDVSSLPPEAIEASQSRLRIISSVYGLLRPHDLIKPYRCEFNKPVFPDPKTPIQVFKPKVTVEFVKYIRENKIADIIDLLPGDADKCIDWKIVRAFASVHKVCFQVFTPEGGLKTPIASRLKELRGLMCRAILQHDIRSFKELTAFESEYFIFSPKDSKPGLPVFLAG